MTTETQATASDLFEEVFKSYEKSLKTGIKIQEDSVKMWKDLLSNAATPTEFQKKIGEAADEILPAARKRMEEALRTVEENYKVSTDLMQQAFQVWQPGSADEMQNRIRQLWESSLSAARTNAQSIVKTNQQILDVWTGMVANGKKQATKAAAK